MNNKISDPSPFGLFTLLPAGIWALGLVSMFMDISSELIHSLLPVFMSTVLGVSMTTIGVVEGIAEATAAITKVFSGALSDYLGKRKLLAVLGYGLAAATKPIFPLAKSIIWVFSARFIDRVGKGIRGAPRDALVADITPPHLRGAAYGLRQALDTFGALLGPLIAVIFMVYFSGNIRAVLWVSVLPALIAVGILIFCVRDPKHLDNDTTRRNPLTLSNAARLPLGYWLTVLLGAVFSLARFSEAFLVLRAQDVGLTLAYVPVIMIVMNIVYTASAYPSGVAADHISRRVLLIGGLGMLVAADFILASATTPLMAFAGSALWGFHMGLTQGLFSKMVADEATPELRGSAFGIFNLVSGGALLLASVIAGLLWSIFGARATFLTGAAFGMIAILGLLAYRSKA